MKRALVAFLFAVPLAARADGQINGTLVTTRNGKPEPVRYSLVWVKGFATAPPATPAHELQTGRAFDPPVLPIVQGQAVEFANGEPNGFWHHVFSPSKPNAFDLARYQAPEKRKQVFYKEGRVDIFCDIHKEMFATIWVLPNASYQLLSGHAAAQTSFHLEHVPRGNYTLVAWNRGATAPVEVPVKVEDGKSTQLEVKLELGQRPLDALLSNHPDAHGHPYTEANRAKESGAW